jgi:hypothetical protein
MLVWLDEIRLTGIQVGETTGDLRISRDHDGVEIDATGGDRSVAIMVAR